MKKGSFKRPTTPTNGTRRGLLSKKRLKTGRFKKTKMKKHRVYQQAEHLAETECARCGDRHRVDDSTGLCGHCTADALMAEELG